MSIKKEIVHTVATGLTRLSEGLQVRVPYYINVKTTDAQGAARSPELAYATDGAAAFDIHCNNFVTIAPTTSAIIETGLHMAIPPGYEGEIRGRSGMAFKSDVIAHNGTIDSDYRGEIKVKLFNLGREAYSIAPGDRIAQMLIREVTRANLVYTPILDTTSRGRGGFGSTGR